MQANESRLANLESQFEADGVSYLLVQFVDLHGAAKVKLVPVSAFRHAVEVGAGFAGGAVWGVGQGPHSHDLCARVDPESYTPLPYEPGIARFAADLYVDDEPHPYCPRVNLGRVVAQARKLGYAFNVGIEPEFFLVTKNADGTVSGWDPHAVDDLAKPCYDFKGMSAALDFLRAMNDGLNALGWGAYQVDHEDANFQYEINFKYSDAMTTADRVTFFRMMAGQVARRVGAIATFMAKPFTERTGSGGHMHYHLADAANGREPLPRPGGPARARPLRHRLPVPRRGRRARQGARGGHVADGQLLQAASRSARRLTGSLSGFTWVPAFITYGDNNRTQMLRVPEPGHVEDRSISSACNPYLAEAAYLAAGLDGIARGLDPGEPNPGNLYQAGPEAMLARGVATLPQSLPEALDCLEADPVVRAGLGPIADEFLKLKRDEWREYHAQVGQWELKQYLTAL